jgi:SSS family solute:Na+ symporter
VRLQAKSVSEAQKGIAFAAFLKLLMPLIVVLPGIAMFALNADLATPDQAYPSGHGLATYGHKRTGLCCPSCGNRLVTGVNV